MAGIDETTKNELTYYHENAHSIEKEEKIVLIDVKTNEKIELKPTDGKTISIWEKVVAWFYTHVPGFDYDKIENHLAKAAKGEFKRITEAYRNLSEEASEGKLSKAQFKERVKVIDQDYLNAVSIFSDFAFKKEKHKKHENETDAEREIIELKGKINKKITESKSYFFRTKPLKIFCQLLDDIRSNNQDAFLMDYFSNREILSNDLRAKLNSKVPVSKMLTDWTERNLSDFERDVKEIRSKIDDKDFEGLGQKINNWKENYNRFLDLLKSRLESMNNRDLSSKLLPKAEKLYADTIESMRVQVGKIQVSEKAELKLLQDSKDEEETSHQDAKLKCEESIKSLEVEIQEKFSQLFGEVDAKFTNIVLAGAKKILGNKGKTTDEIDKLPTLSLLAVKGLHKKTKSTLQEIEKNRIDLKNNLADLSEKFIAFQEKNKETLTLLESAEKEYNSKVSRLQKAMDKKSISGNAAVITAKELKLGSGEKDKKAKDFINRRDELIKIIEDKENQHIKNEQQKLEKDIDECIKKIEINNKEHKSLLTILEGVELQQKNNFEIEEINKRLADREAEYMKNKKELDGVIVKHKRNLLHLKRILLALPQMDQ